MISSEQTIFNLTIFRPISCYTGSLTAEIKGDVSLDESLLDAEDDVKVECPVPEKVSVPKH